MGVVLAFGLCIRCGDSFAFNPARVPSSSVLTGEREPICRPCFEFLNLTRAGLGLPAWELPDDAYDPCDEADL